MKWNDKKELRLFLITFRLMLKPRMEEYVDSFTNQYYVDPESRAGRSV